MLAARVKLVVEGAKTNLSLENFGQGLCLHWRGQFWLSLPQCQLISELLKPPVACELGASAWMKILFPSICNSARACLQTSWPFNLRLQAFLQGHHREVQGWCSSVPREGLTRAKAVLLQQEITLASESTVVCVPGGIILTLRVRDSCSKRTLGSELLSAVQSQAHHITRQQSPISFRVSSVAR